MVWRAWRREACGVRLSVAHERAVLAARRAGHAGGAWWRAEVCVQMLWEERLRNADGEAGRHVCERHPSRRPNRLVGSAACRLA